MDPFSAVAFAGTILTFVDFSWNLIKGSYEVYQSVTGETVENARINDVISDLRSVSEDLDGTPTGDSRHEKALRKLAAECSELSTDLMDLLKKLKRNEKKNIVWSSLRAKWASMRKSSDVASMLERLHDYRSEIMLRLNLMLSDQQSSIEVQLKQIRKEATELNTATAAELYKLRSDILAAVTAIREREDEYDSDSETLRPSEAGEAPTGKAPDPQAGKHSLQGVHGLLVELVSQAKGINIQHDILRQLDFKSRYAREETIQDAEAGTFEWLLWDGVDDDSSDSEGAHSGPTDGLPDTDIGSNQWWEVEYGTDALPTSPSSPGHGSSSDDESCSGDFKDHDPQTASQQPVNVESPDSQTGGEFLAQPDGPVKANLAAAAETVGGVETATGDIPSPVPETASDTGGEAPRRRHQSAFMSWLRYGSHIFHVSGKAGSGKSTLMKFAYTDERTTRALQEWASPKKLVTAHFYFWRSAQDELQMSLDGLYRSILFEVLCQCPDLIPDVFSQQWDAMAHQKDIQLGDHMAASAVRRAFEVLVSKASNPTHRFCLFIDGLDEYHGDSLAHWELARHLQAWTRQADSDIKMCISARPHTEYLVTFSGPPNTTIHLHELTRQDIYNFSVKMFDKDQNATTLSKEACADLANKIVDKAEGVFLWAWLTVRLLLDSLGRRDKPEILFQRLEGVPEGLDDLYNRLLSTVLVADRRRSDLALLLAVSNPFPEPLNAIAYTWLDELDLRSGGFSASAMNLQPFSDAGIKDAHDYVRRQLHSLTKGLLEMYPFSSSGSGFFALGVQFFHRTAMDYLSSPVQFETLRTRHHARANLGHAFAWLRLAEYKCGIDRRSIDGWTSAGASRFPHDFLVETLHCIASELPAPVAEGFRVAVTRHLESTPPSPSTRSTGTSNTMKPRYSVPVLFATHGNSDGASFYDCHVHGSWPHFAAAYAQTQHVLDLVSQQPEIALVDDEVGELSLLLSAMTGGNARLARELVHRSSGRLLHDCVAMRDRTHSRSKAPVWLLAVANHVWRLIRAMGSGSPMQGRKTGSAIRALREWIDFGADANLVLEVKELGAPFASPPPFDAEAGDTDDDDHDEDEDDDDDDDDTDSERSSSSSSDGTPRSPRGGKPAFQTYWCTIERFLALCESRRWVHFDDDRRRGRDEPPPPPPREELPQDHDDNQPDDIVHSRLFEMVKSHPRIWEQSGDVHASFLWKGKALGLPFTYRVY